MFGTDYFDVFVTCHETPATGGSGGDTGGDPATGGTGGTGGATTFTQAQVDSIVANRLKGVTTEKQKLVTQLESLQSNSKLTTEERDQLQTQINDLQTSMMTKEEMSAKRAKDLETKFQKDLDSTKGEATRWKGMFETSTVQRALMDAAVGSAAMAPSQIVMMLSPFTRLVEVKNDDGTSQLVPHAKIQGLDTEGKSVTLDLPVDEAVKVMKDTPKLYGNLFKGTATSGTGENPLTGGGTGGALTDAQIAKMTPAQWKEHRGKFGLGK